MIELKPCPFCGDMPYHNPDGGFTYCETDPCLFSKSNTFYKDWQKRPIEDALNNLIAELEQENATLRGRIWEHEAKGGFEDNATLKESQVEMSDENGQPEESQSYLINIFDEMPKNKQRVLVYLSSDKYCDAMYFIDDVLEFAGFIFDIDNQPDGYVTHWMPLPEPPESE